MPPKRKGDTSSETTEGAGDVSVDSSNTKSTKRSKRESTTVKPELDIETTPPKGTERTTRNKSQASTAGSSVGLNAYLEDYFDVICSYQDDNQRYLANVFYVLPSASLYPDYYEIIKKPIDLREVAKRILSSQYTSINQMESDLSLMMDNARKYNDPKSVIYKDANKLKTLIRETGKELGSLLRANKPFASMKSHDKKLKLLQEIAELESNEDTIKKIGPAQPSTTHADEQDDDDNENSDEDEGDDESEADDEINKSGDSHGDPHGGKKPQDVVVSAMWQLFDFVKDFRHGNQTIIDPFVKLPSKRAYPDYYEEIKRPIALSIIQTKLKKRRYSSIAELMADFELLFGNAMQYNVEESLIYSNAKRLVEALRQKKNELSSEVLNAKLAVSKVKSPSTPKKTKTVAKSAANTTPHGKTTAGKSGVNMLDHNLKRLYKLLIDYCEEDKSKSQIDKKVPGAKSSRAVVPLSHHFMTLVKREQNPEFYEKVKDPMDLTIVKEKIDSGQYKSELEMVNDCIKIFQNARLVHNEVSQIHQDAIKLQAYLTNRYQILTNQRHKGADLLEPARDHKPTVIPKFNDVKEKLVYLYNYINDYQIEGRDLAYPFRHLPSRTEYPDYYNIIKKPMDMTKIWHKLNQYGYTSSYVTLDDMCADFAQMFENACVYNEPGSMIYKDALNMQRALFTRRDEILASELAQITGDDFSAHESLPADFVANQVQEIIESLFEACVGYQDAEGRPLVDSFVELAYLWELEAGNEPVITLEIIRQRIRDRVYKRLDSFQDELFELFAYTRSRSYFESKPSGSTSNRTKIHRFSQLYKDSYELQRYYMQKRDELCRNGELLNSPALSYKPHALDTHISALIGPIPDPSFDENDALLVDDRYRPLEKTITSGSSGEVRVGNYYLLSRDLVRSGLHPAHNGSQSARTDPIIVCVLASDSTHFVGQLYLRPDDDEFVAIELRRLRRCFEREVFKSDLYTKIDLKRAQPELTNASCLVVGIRQFVTFEPNFESTEDNQEPLIHIKPEHIFVCESYLSTAFGYFRKLGTKKWSPLGAISSTAPEPASYNFTFTKRPNPLQLERSYSDPKYIETLTRGLDSKMAPLYANKPPQRAYFRETIEFDTLPSVSKDLEDNEGGGADEDILELAKSSKFFEQVNTGSDLYKLGDYVYVRYQQLSPNIPSRDEFKLPLIVRIDRLWAAKNNPNQVLFKGPVFLRSTDIPHEPTRLFYKNEVFKEMSRQITATLSEITESPFGSRQKKCVVMSTRRYTTCRSTEIDERDVYVCEAKYSLQTKLFRKFTKELKSVKLSSRCLEDEIYVLRRDLILRKHLSPLLETLEIDYDDQSADYLRDFNDPQSQAVDESVALGGGLDRDDSTRDGIDSSHDENSQMEMISPQASVDRTPRNSNKVSFLIENGVTSVSTSASATRLKKERLKRPKKSGFNMFSKEFRKSLRDTKSSLSFIDMSKEVGLRWRALSEKQRAEYEQKAIIATKREQEKYDAEQAAVAAQQQQQQAQEAQLANANKLITIQPTVSQQPITLNGQPIYLSQSPHQPIILQQANTGQVSGTASPVLIQQIPNGVKQTPIILYPNQSQSPQPFQQIQHPNVQQASNNLLPYDYPQQTVAPVNEGPKQVQHREAYLRYIANLKRNHQIQNSPAANNPIANAAQVQQADWFSGLDVRPNRIREKRVQAPSLAWIENCPSEDVLQHLVSLRYHLLNDALNIRKKSDEPELIEQPEETSNGDEPMVVQ